jgi:hypothetical protein
MGIDVMLCSLRFVQCIYGVDVKGRIEVKTLWLHAALNFFMLFFLWNTSLQSIFGRPLPSSCSRSEAEEARFRSSSSSLCCNRANRFEESCSNRSGL